MGEILNITAVRNLY